MKRNNSQRGRYSKRKGAQKERKTAKILTKWARKDFGKTAQFGRTLSSGASANQFINPNADLLGDIYPVDVPGWNFSWECKNYNSTTLRRFYEGTTRLSAFLEENTRDARRHEHVAVPVLDCHINRFRDMIMLPYEKQFFNIMIQAGYPCFSTMESYTVKKTQHKFWFHVILTDLQSMVKALSCKEFIHIYKNCKWDARNKRYTKNLTHLFLQRHSRAEMSGKYNK